MMAEKYNYTEEELIKMYIDFSKKVGVGETGASSKVLKAKAKEFGIPSYKYFMNFFIINNQ